MVQPLWKTVWRPIRKLKTELPYDPAAPLLSIYPDKPLIQKHSVHPICTAAQFTITKTWEQLERPLTEEWVKKMWHVHIMEYHSPIKKNEIMASAAIWMQPEVIIRTEVSQKEKDKYCIISLTCGIYNMTQMNLHNRNRPINRTDLWLLQERGLRTGGGGG